ncbi:hypothetical protein SETIT_2G103800v2 [Setaria italica]|uniref:Uncharacterized protein n=1 Tax=Setaria italica TaxID=4555 RepID=K3ZZY7_SETIT|nr:transcription factor SRM1 [Setaria italica]RCV10331.1 hypothetical protein SETIT_2G103800v2 [Setaria italica]
MDPKFNGEWSASDIKMVKSLIASHNPNNNYADGMNKKHNDIVNDIQVWFPWKERHQVIELYVELVVEMISLTQSGNQSVVAIDNLVSDNSGILVGNPSIDNMDMSFANMKGKTPEATRMVDEVPQRKAIVPQQGGWHNRSFWTKEEHRQFLYGLRKYGRGKWKDISREFVTTRTPVQVSSHAQKYFRRQNNSEKQRYSINDVSLYDAEPWAQNNSSNWEAPAFAGGAYNPNYYGSGSQVATMNNLAQVWPPFMYSADQASSSQATTWTGQQMGPSSSAALALEGAGSQMAWTGDQEGDILPEQWMNIDNV